MVAFSTIAATVLAGVSVANGIMSASAASKAARSNREFLAAKKQYGAESLDLQTQQQEELTRELIFRQGLSWDTAVGQTKRDLSLLGEQSDEALARLRTDEAANLSQLRGNNSALLTELRGNESASLTQLRSNEGRSLSLLRTNEGKSLDLLRGQVGETVASGVTQAGQVRTNATGQLQRSTDLTIGQARDALSETENQIRGRLRLERGITDQIQARERQRGEYETGVISKTAELAAKEASAQQELRGRKLRITNSDAMASAAGRGVAVGTGSARAVVDRNKAFATTDDRAAAVQTMGRQSLYRGQIEQRGKETEYAVQEVENAYQRRKLEGLDQAQSAKRQAGDVEESSQEKLRSGTENAELTYQQAVDNLRRQGRQTVDSATLESGQRLSGAELQSEQRIGATELESRQRISGAELESGQQIGNATLKSTQAIGAAKMESDQQIRRANYAATTSLEDLANSINAQLGSRALAQKQTVEEGELNLKWSDVLDSLSTSMKNDQLKIERISSLVGGFGGAASALYSGYKTAVDTGAKSYFGFSLPKK